MDPEYILREHLWIYLGLLIYNSVLEHIVFYLTNMILYNIKFKPNNSDIKILWLTASKAFLRSRNTAPTTSPLSNRN